MEQKLFIELYNFVSDVNTLLSNLSEENFESADIAGVVEGMEKLYNRVEREGLDRLERIKINKIPDDYHDSGSNSHFNTHSVMPFLKGGNIEDCFQEEMHKEWEDENDCY